MRCGKNSAFNKQADAVGEIQRYTADYTRASGRGGQSCSELGANVRCGFTHGSNHMEWCNCVLF